MSRLKSVNDYSMELTELQIRNKVHRDYVGGMWEELGKLQLEFLINSGLKPNHKLLDIGCGSLRGGIRFIEYLQEGHYFGLDINRSLIEAGKVELEEAGLSDKSPTLMVDDGFSIDKFSQQFDFMVSISLFTHLPMNFILRCLKMARGNLAPDGVYFSTFFQAPDSVYLETINQQPGGIDTHFDSDPFHYSAEEIHAMATLAKLDVKIIGDWEHPRNQKMAAFSLA